MHPAQLAEQASDDDNHQRAEEEVGEHVLARGSLRAAIIGVRKMPAARNDVTTQKIESCTCHVRTMLNGKKRSLSIPKKPPISAR